MKICPVCRRRYENAAVEFCLSDGQPLVRADNNDTAASHSPPAANVAAQTTAPFSASLAMAFFAHYFIPPPAGFSGKTNVLCQPNLQVNSTALAENLPAIAFWNLREHNMIRFAPGVQQGLIFKRTRLVVQYNRSNQTRIPGLEFDLFEIIKQSAPGATVKDVVYQFLAETTEYPREKIFLRMAQWMVQLGYGQHGVLPKPFFYNRASLNFEFTPACERVAGSERAAQTIHRAWTKFHHEQPEVFRYLSDDIKAAVNDRTYRDTSSSDFGGSSFNPHD